MSHQVSRAAVIGAGQMGLGIAYVTALFAKIPVGLHDPSSNGLKRAMENLDKIFARDVAKNRFSQEDVDAARARISPIQGDGTDANGGTVVHADTDIVIEAIPEITDLKLGLMHRLATCLPAPAILGTNTSSISITRLAAAASQADDGGESSGRVVGVHFFNPVNMMKLCEVIPATQTTSETLRRAKAFGEACGKTVAVSSDNPGFISNAILMPMINEAIMLLERGVATKEDIDTTFKLGMGHPMGPLTLADLIGLDTCLNIQNVLYNESSDSKYRPATLLKRMVDAGYYGRKSGRGFYTY
ncbi:hypothetical protein CspHIS471_0403800 [Cutaneotrichosporon sp. HIS471]|nr:hypothetical protein CspHIS471_0403800 [Cutaneotrichosporon sp. HIS471]